MHTALAAFEWKDLITQIEWRATIASVASGGGTVASVNYDLVNTGIAALGATAAIVASIVAIYYHRKNYVLNRDKIEYDREHDLLYHHHVDLEGGHMGPFPPEDEEK